MVQVRPGGTNTKALNPSETLTKSTGPDTAVLELLMLKHDRTYLKVDSEESIYIL